MSEQKFGEAFLSRASLNLWVGIGLIPVGIFVLCGSFWLMNADLGQVTDAGNSVLALFTLLAFVGGPVLALVGAWRVDAAWNMLVDAINTLQAPNNQNVETADTNPAS
jgi:hypothetical protein